MRLVYRDFVEYPEPVTGAGDCLFYDLRMTFRGFLMGHSFANPRSSAVVFDLDDTLYPERMFVEGGLKAAGDLLDSISNSAVKSLNVFNDVIETEGPFHIFDRSLEILGVERTPELIAALVSAYRCHNPATSPFPGTVEMLQMLRGHGIGLGVLTDGYVEVQKAKWHALGIEQHVDAVVFCGDVDGRSFPKPAPEAFIHARLLLGNPETIIYVGDNPAKDFPAPDALGWKTVRVCRPDTWHCNDADLSPFAVARPIVTSVAQLGQLLLDMTQG